MHPLGLPLCPLSPCALHALPTMLISPKSPLLMLQTSYEVFFALRAGSSLSFMPHFCLSRSSWAPGPSYYPYLVYFLLLFQSLTLSIAPTIFFAHECTFQPSAIPQVVFSFLAASFLCFRLNFCFSGLAGHRLEMLMKSSSGTTSALTTTLTFILQHFCTVRTLHSPLSTCYMPIPTRRCNLHTLFMVLHFCQSIYPSLYSNHQNS